MGWMRCIELLRSGREAKLSRRCRSAPCARCSCCIQSEERSVAYGARVTFLLRGQEKSNQKRRPPRLALAGLPARQVRASRPGFSTGHPALAKRSRHPCRLPLRGLSTPPHRRTGAPGKAAGHPGPHSSEEPEQSEAEAPARSVVGNGGYRPEADILDIAFCARSCARQVRRHSPVDDLSSNTSFVAFAVFSIMLAALIAMSSCKDR